MTMTFPTVFFAVLFVLDILLVTSSRLLHCIRIVALQGVLLGIMPVTLAIGHGDIHWSVMIINLSLKGIILPCLLYRTMLKAGVKRELEPVIGYSLSAGVVLALILFSFFISGRLSLPAGASDLAGLAVPCSFAVVMTGLFTVIARKKALTQVIGFLVFENGITLFGAAVMREHPLIVELGILLDVLVLVFIMGISVFQISREFSHIDADRLNSLKEEAR